MLAAIPSNAPTTAQEISDSVFGSGARVAEDFFPYPSKGMMKTDILFSSPRLRFSREQQEAILAWGRGLGAKDVPSLYAVEKFQKAALDTVGDPTVKVRAESGNLLYMNSLLNAMSRDYAHPETRQQIRAYPEYPTGPVSEVWQSSKWLVDAPDDVLTPMARIEGKDYYVKELAYCCDKTWFVPMRFFKRDTEMWAVGHRTSQSSDGLHVATERSVERCANFLNNWPEIEAHTAGRKVFADDSIEWAACMPNPDRAIADGLEWECPPVIVFIDDVSGNSTKQWNVHYSAYMSNAAMPRSSLEKERNIRFVATSPHASPMEIMQAICNDLNAGGSTPVRAWDSIRKRHILLRPWLLFLPGDNPMQAELCSHIGLNANLFCRCCMAGGTKAFKESNDGFCSLMEPGQPRNPVETRNAVLEQLSNATHAAASKPLQDAMTKTGVKDSLAMPVITRLLTIGKALRRSTPSRRPVSIVDTEKYLREELLKLKQSSIVNPLLDMPGLDVHKDTPVEPLHTVILGIIKYFWGQTTWTIEKQGQWAIFQARLNSLDQSGLDIPNIMADYICRYRGSLIGKHFKTISQVIAFAAVGLVGQKLQDAWHAIGRLVVLIWETEIHDLKSYTDELRSVIQDVQDSAAALSPSLLTLKSKFHILLHLPEHILRFGPALLFSTERYESFNRIFRLCSIHSNRQAPSRDIAVAFANQDRCRHVMTGGFWHDSKQKKWVSASPAVIDHLKESPHDARLLGVAVVRTPQPGTMTFPPLSRSEPNSARDLTWSQTKAMQLAPGNEMRIGLWRAAQTLVTKTGDTAREGSEVLIHDRLGDSDASGSLLFGSVIQLLAPISPEARPAVVVRLSTLQSHVHNLLKLPVLERTGPVKYFDAQDIVCVVNIQHDCATQGCIADAREALRQEREETSRTRAIIRHRDTTTFIINMHSIHNRQYLKKAIPSSLQQRSPLFEDRDRLHMDAATSLRDQKLQKKIAKDTAIRKRAEEALRVANERGGLSTVLLEEEGRELPDEVSIPLDTNTAEHDLNELTEGSDTHSRGNGLPHIVPALPLSEPIPFDDLLLPRGPRQRRTHEQPTMSSMAEGSRLHAIEFQSFTTQLDEPFMVRQGRGDDTELQSEPGPSHVRGRGRGQARARGQARGRGRGRVQARGRGRGRGRAQAQGR
ncbi:uncharacterized protein B0H18DRAFT_907557, partial [Fomitopsis serialis]|uniref:uncharacterized protein n=1 Tax=Fomitopsis serialis TaxID=139415 RepID=UPI002007AC44